MGISAWYRQPTLAPRHRFLVGTVCFVALVAAAGSSPPTPLLGIPGLSTVAVSLISALGGGLVAAFLNAREKRHEVDTSASVQRELQSDTLALELLHTAREERSLLKTELDRWKALAAHMDEHDLALAHLETMITAETEKEREVAVRAAAAFLARVKRRRETAGDFRNEVQVSVSEIRATGAAA